MADGAQDIGLPIDTQQLQELLLRLHGLAREPGGMRHFLQGCAEAFQAATVSFSITELRTAIWRHVEVYPGELEKLDVYQNTYFRTDPLRAAIARAPARDVHAISELLEPEVFQTDPYLRDWWCGKWGMRDSLFVRFPVGTQYDCNVGVSRRQDQPPFGESERVLLQLLQPHVEQVMTLHNQLDRLGIFADIAQEQLLQSGQGLVVLSEEGLPVYMNRVAGRLLQDGQVFVQDNGRLTLRDAAAGERFHELVRQCVQASRQRTWITSGSLSLPRAGAQPLVVSVMPYRRQEGMERLLARGGRAVVTFLDPDRPRVDMRRQLREMYHLSESEAEVCWRVGNGDTVGDIAQSMGCKQETVRSQLKRVFGKTGTRRQPDLVRLVLLGPAAWTRMA